MNVPWLSLVLGLSCVIIGILACSWGLWHGLWEFTIWRYAMGVWAMVSVVWIVMALSSVLHK